MPLLLFGPLPTNLLPLVCWMIPFFFAVFLLAPDFGRCLCALLLLSVLRFPLFIASAVRIMCVSSFLHPLHVASLSAIGVAILVVFLTLLTAMFLGPLLLAPLSALGLVSGPAHVASRAFSFR